MSALAGTTSLIRADLRRDRIRIAIWVISVALFVLVTAASTKGLYPTQADLDQAAVASQGNPAALALNGPDQALDTLGGQIAFQVGAGGLTLVGLMALLELVRLTRSEEDSGRMELVCSLPIGRYAPLAAALVVVTSMSVLAGVLVTATCLAVDLPIAGSLVFGASFAVIGILFAGIAAVTAQAAQNPRVAGGVAGAVLGAGYVVRAAGDAAGGGPSWLSPIGVAQKARPFAGERWWPLVLLLVLAAGLVALASVLVSHRDFGAGLFQERPGPPHASAGLGRPVGLAVRSTRASVAWWAFAAFVLGASYGSLANSIEEFVADNEALSEVVAGMGGGSIVDAYLGTSMLVLALVAGCAAIQVASRVRSEEVSGRTEALLAAPVSRPRWLGAHLAVALVGSAAVLVGGGVGLGLAYGLVIGEPSQIVRLAAAALVYAPAVWLLVGAVAVLFGLVPRATVGAWALVAGCFVLAMFGTLLDLPSWVMNLSPFDQTPRVPAVDVRLVPLAAISVLAVGAMALGAVGFRRRDIG